MKNLLTVAALLLFVGSLIAQDVNPDGSPMTPADKVKNMSEQEMMEMWMKSITPGEEHAKLAEDVGTYTYTNTFWMEPGAEPSVSEGQMIIEPIMDGRYFKETHTGSAMGMPFNGIGLNGYDNVTQEYVSTWMDNMGTGIMIFKGNYEDGQLIMTTTTTNPMTRMSEMHKIVRTPTEKGWDMDYYVVELGNEFRTMNIKFVKTK